MKTIDVIIYTSNVHIHDYGSLFFVVNRYSRVFYTRLQSEFVFKWLTAYYCRLGRGGYLFLRFYATNEFLTSTQTGSKFQLQHEMSQKRLGEDDKSSFQCRRIVIWVTWQHDVTIKKNFTSGKRCWFELSTAEDIHQTYLPGSNNFPIVFKIFLVQTNIRS